jgi:ribosomal protein S14
LCQCFTQKMLSTIMSNSIQRDLKRRKLYLKNLLKRIEYKALIHNVVLSKKERYKSILDLNKITRNSSPVRVKNRCVLTGRNHAVLRFCRLSRIKFRELANQGLLMGVMKSSW